MFLNLHTSRWGGYHTPAPDRFGNTTLTLIPELFDRLEEDPGSKLYQFLVFSPLFLWPSWYILVLIYSFAQLMLRGNADYPVLEVISMLVYSVVLGFLAVAYNYFSAFINPMLTGYATYYFFENGFGQGWRTYLPSPMEWIFDTLPGPIPEFFAVQIGLIFFAQILFGLMYWFVD